MSQNLPVPSAPTRASNQVTSGNPSASTASTPAPRRVSSAVLMGDGRAIEIEHGGRVYQLRITQLNKLILTA
ncbi:hemin uptake protein HemP [Duganella fentianensis]|uniref:hemin uptake protein HemP n=1 Tax=Duganella fentianensis TaxID=2692177 RepID=UPI0032B214D4